MYRTTLVLNEKQKQELEKILESHEVFRKQFVTQGKGKQAGKLQVNFKKIGVFPTEKTSQVETDRAITFHVKDKKGQHTGETIVVIHSDNLRFVGRSKSKIEHSFTRPQKDLNIIVAKGRALVAAATMLGMMSPRTFNHKMFGYRIEDTTKWSKSVPKWMIESKPKDKIKIPTKVAELQAAV